MLRFHLARMFAREAGTREGRDAGGAPRHAGRHPAPAGRVARVRRLPSTSGGRGATASRLRDVAADLGAVRDLDVLIEAAEAYQKGQSAKEAAAFEPLVATWRTRREAARVLLVHELDSKRYAKWTEEYAAFVQAEGAGSRPVGPTEPHRVRDAMPSRIWAAYEAVRAYEPVMRWADVNTLHDLRIAAKWLRYTLEFVREALGRRGRARSSRRWSRSRTTSAGSTTPTSPPGWPGRSSWSTRATSTSRRAPRSAATSWTASASWRGCAGPSGTTWRGVSSLAFRRALGRLVAGL